MMCMMVVCLAMSGFSSRVITSVDYYLDFQGQEVEQIREEMKDAKKLREHMERLLNGTVNHERAEQIKQKYDINDEAMQTILLGVVREASAKNKWQVPEKRTKDNEHIVIAYWRLHEAIVWLSACADAEGKRFLMSVITDNEKHSEFRRAAGWSYLRCADAQEIRDILPRFFADSIWTDVYSFSLYHNMIKVYDRMEGDAQTREAIVAAMSAALAKEEDKNAFAEGDKLLAERNKEYAESPQRKAALERMNKPPDKPQ